MNERSIFERSLDFEDESSRHEYIQGACGSDEGLLRQVESLLAAHAEECRLLDDRVVPAIETEVQQPGQSIGTYQLREQIGEGGMGVVYVAEQTEPVQRKVALKIIKPGMDTKEVIARFEAERQALAFMEHPNIARVLDAGTTNSRRSLRDRSVQTATDSNSQIDAASDRNATIGGAIGDYGRPYFVMELVRGIPITEYCDQVKATPRERLELFQTVCDAVQHAHQKGIIHRDIKPSNVLVTQVSAKPVVKVIDFGLAKAVSGQRLTEKTLYTGFMKLMGTPAYMSPEQAGLSGLDVDTRSDIYSLGVLLYELLTGSTPLDKTEIQKQAYDELCRQIREVDAPKPSTRFSTLQDAERTTVAEQRKIEPRELRQLLSGDLDLVVLKAIEKDRDRRYGSPQDLAADVGRFLDDQPVSAVSPSQWYLAQKYMRRHKAAILMAATVLLVLLGATIVSTWQAIRVSKANQIAALERNAARRAEVEAVEAKERAEKAQQDAFASEEQTRQLAEESRRMLYASNMLNADQLWNNRSGTPKEIQELLVRWIPTDGQEDLRDFAWRFQWTRLHLNAAQTTTGVQAASFTSDGNLVVSDKSGIREWDESTNRFIERYHKNGILSPCGRWAAIREASDSEVVMRLIEIASGRVAFEFPGNRAKFSDSGDDLLVWENRRKPKFKNYRHHLWSTSDGTETPLPSAIRATLESNSTLQITADGESVGAISKGGASGNDVEVFFPGDSEPNVWNSPSGAVASAWTPSRSFVVVGRYGGELHFHPTSARNNPLVVNNRGMTPRSLAFSRDSQLLAVGTREGTIDIYDVSRLDALISETTGTKPNSLSLGRVEHRRGEGMNLPGSNALPLRSQPSPLDNSRPSRKRESEEHAPSKLKSSVRNADAIELVRTLNAHIEEVSSVTFSLDGTKLVSRDDSGVAKLWDLTDPAEPIHSVESKKYPLGSGVGVELETTAKGVRVTQVHPSQHELISGEIRRGDMIASVTDETGICVIEDHMDWRDVRRMLAGPYDSTVDLQVRRDDSPETQPVSLRRRRETELPTGSDLTFTPDGASILLASLQGLARVSMSGNAGWTYPALCSSPCISSDGKLLAIDDCRKLLLWNLQADKLHATYDMGVADDRRAKSHDRGTTAFSPDGRYVAIGSSHRLASIARPSYSNLRVWNVASGEEIGDPFLEHDSPLPGVCFTPDSETLIATDNYGAMHAWDTSTWRLTKTVQGFENTLTLAISPDGKTLAQGGMDGFIIWDLPEFTKRRSFRDQSVSDFTFSRDGRTLVSSSFNGKAVMWDPARGMKLATIAIDKGDFSACALSPTDDKLSILSFDGRLWLRDVLPLDELDQHPLTTAALYNRGVALNDDGQFAIAEQTLKLALDVQSRTLPHDHADLADTRKAWMDSLRAQGPKIVKQIDNQFVPLGEAAALNVKVQFDNKLGKVTYRWYFGDELIEDVDQPTIEISRVGAEQLGRYRVEVHWGPPELDLHVDSSAFIVDAALPIAKGGLRHEVYRDIKGTSVGDLTTSPKFPDLPDQVGALGDFELPVNVGDNYGARILGFLIPPRSGEYVFYLCSDDSSELYLHDDGLVDNTESIAKLNGWHSPRQWETLTEESVSKPIRLIAGRRYWVEAHFKEGYGDEHLAVTWQMPDEPPPKNGDPPIPGRFLEHRLE